MVELQLNLVYTCFYALRLILNYTKNKGSSLVLQSLLYFMPNAYFIFKSFAGWFETYM